MAPLRRWLVVALMAAIGVGCGKDRGATSGAASASASASAPPPPAAPSAASAAPGPTPAPSGALTVADAGAAKPEPPRITRRTGLVGEIFTRAHGLALKDEQRVVVDRIDQELWGPEQKDEDERNAIKEFVSLLIEGAKSGRIDNAKLAPQIAALEKAAQARREKEAAALGELHGVLDAAQRKQLVETMRRIYPAHPAKPPNKPAAAKAPKSAKPTAKPAKPVPSAAELEKKRKADRKKQRITLVATLLGLDEAQKRRVEPILERFDPEKANEAHRAKLDKRRQALLKVFEQDNPEASQLDLGSGPRAMLQNRVAFVTALLAVLKADQRAKLARTIERPSGRHWGGIIVGQPGPIADG